MYVTIQALGLIKEDFLTIPQAATVLEVSDDTIRRYLRKGLPHLLLTKVRIPRKGLIEYMNAKSTGIIFVDPGYQGGQD